VTRKKVISLNIDTGGYKEFVDRIIHLSQAEKSSYVCVANVHMLVEGYRDKHYASEVNDAALITPDGMPLSWSIRLLYGNHQDRVAGMDLLPDLLQECAYQRIPVFFYGSTPTMLQKGNNILKQKFPGLKIAGSYSPPFSTSVSDLTQDDIVSEINNSGARVVFVILGCPKQEKWMASMKGKINAVMIGIGGAYPVLLGLQHRAPTWMRKNGLEWLYRLGQEPRRLFKRYAVTNSLFSYLLAREYLHTVLLKRASN
jgi:N-acetylglucosaminyldiphosphoundecaprenol N-acetyl-beta-D-mannosaminyltransferase